MIAFVPAAALAVVLGQEPRIDRAGAAAGAATLLAEVPAATAATERIRPNGGASVHRPNRGPWWAFMANPWRQDTEVVGSRRSLRKDSAHTPKINTGARRRI